MDPQSQTFTPFGSTQLDVAEFQRKLTEYGNRITHIERRQEEDAHVKSIWGPSHSSPFPSALSGTPQQAPQQYPSTDNFRTYDDNTNAMMSSLHLDADDEPRSRALGATSRANSVRFDETANQNHFSTHSARPSLDYTSRQSSGYSGGLHMNERTPSHRSEGRASSVHSHRSLASGRASSTNPDDGTGDSSPVEPPGIAPGQIILGPAQAIFRVWLEQEFTQENLLYAVACSGSYRSWIDVRLIERLGIQQAIVRHDDEGLRAITMRLWFPEGTQSPRTLPAPRSDPLQMLPSLELTFRVLERSSPENQSKAIQVIIGTDVLSAHEADILLSENKLTMDDNYKRRLTIPFIRPENAAVFNTLRLTSDASPPPPPPSNAPLRREEPPKEPPVLDGLGRAGSSAHTPSTTTHTPGTTVYTPSGTSTTTSPPPGSASIAGNVANPGSAGKYRPPGALALAEYGSSEPTKLGALGSEADAPPTSRQSSVSKPSLSLLNTRPDEAPAQPSPQPAAPPAGSASGLWGSWRSRDGAQSSSTTPASAAAGGSMDWGAASKGRETSYTRKETGMKVLKPKTANRTFSGTAATPTTAGTSSPAEGRSTSRFFPEGRGASDDHSEPRPVAKENQFLPGSATKSSKANPIGGGSAFKFLGTK